MWSHLRWWLIFLGCFFISTSWMVARSGTDKRDAKDCKRAKNNGWARHWYCVMDILVPWRFNHNSREKYIDKKSGRERCVKKIKAQGPSVNEKEGIGDVYEWIITVWYHTRRHKKLQNYKACLSRLKGAWRLTVYSTCILIKNNEYEV